MADEQRLVHTKRRKIVKPKTIKGKVARLERIISTTLTPEWKRQYFFSANGNLQAQASPPMIYNLQTMRTLDATGLVVCPTDWLTSLTGPVTSGMPSSSFILGDKMSGKAIDLKYLEFGIQLRAYQPFDSTTDQKFPIWPVRIIVVQSVGNGAIFTAGLGGTGLPTSQREGNFSNYQTASLALFGTAPGGYANTINDGYSPVIAPTMAPLDRDMGGSSKQFKILLDEIINPQIPLTGSADTVNGAFSKVYRINGPFRPVDFETVPSGDPLFANFFNGEGAQYNNGCIQIIAINDWRPDATTPTGLDNQTITIQGFMSYTDM